MNKGFVLQEKDGTYLSGYYFGLQGVKTRYKKELKFAMVFASRREAETLIEDIKAISTGAAESLTIVEKK